MSSGPGRAGLSRRSRRRSDTGLGSMGTRKEPGNDWIGASIQELDKLVLGNKYNVLQTRKSIQPEKSPNTKCATRSE